MRIFFQKHHSLLALIFVFIIALFFRLYKLSTIPYGLNNDAAWEGSAALDILRGNISIYLPYAAEGWRGEGLIRIIVAFLTAVFGNNQINIRIASVIFGIALIIPVFLLIKKLFNLQIAALTSFFIAISGWHITLSKTGWRAIATPFFATISFYFLFRLLETNKKTDAILCGIFLAGSMYTYDAARITPILFIYFIGILFIIKFRIMRKNLNNIFLILITFTICSLPMINYGIHHYQNFTARSKFLYIGDQIKQTGNFSPLFENIKTTILLFNQKANGNDFFIDDPLVDQPISWLIPLGFIITFWQLIKFRTTPHIFIVSWFIFSLIPGILSSPNGNRDIGSIPTVYFFTAIGLFFLSSLINRIFKRKSFSVVFIIAFCFISLLLSYQAYLGSERKELKGFYPETLVTTNYIRTIWADYNIYLTDNYPRELLTYYLYKPENLPFTENYTWVENSSQFLRMLNDNLANQNKSTALFMFENSQNEMIAKIITQQFPNSRKLYLWYDNDNIHRVASLVILIPTKQ